MTTNTKKRNNKQFSRKKIYYSGSIQGIKNLEPNFAWELVQFMISHGADVLSEHVAGRNQAELDEIFTKRSGYVRKKLDNPEEIARKVDMGWVDEATHLIALVNGPSHGVGMEIERALHKPSRGLNETPILCLVHEGLYNKLSWMIKGVIKDEAPQFRLTTYTDLKNAKEIVREFLTSC